MLFTEGLSHSETINNNLHWDCSVHHPVGDHQVPEQEGQLLLVPGQVLQNNLPEQCWGLCIHFQHGLISHAYKHEVLHQLHSLEEVR